MFCDVFPSSGTKLRTSATMAFNAQGFQFGNNGNPQGFFGNQHNQPQFGGNPIGAFGGGGMMMPNGMMMPQPGTAPFGNNFGQGGYGRKQKGGFGGGGGKGAACAMAAFETVTNFMMGKAQQDECEKHLKAEAEKKAEQEQPTKDEHAALLATTKDMVTSAVQSLTEENAKTVQNLTAMITPRGPKRAAAAAFAPDDDADEDDEEVPAASPGEMPRRRVLATPGANSGRKRFPDELYSDQKPPARRPRGRPAAPAPLATTAQISPVLKRKLTARALKHISKELNIESDFTVADAPDVRALPVLLDGHESGGIAELEPVLRDLHRLHDSHQRGPPRAGRAHDLQGLRGAVSSQLLWLPSLQPDPPCGTVCRRCRTR